MLQSTRKALSHIIWFTTDGRLIERNYLVFLMRGCGTQVFPVLLCWGHGGTEISVKTKTVIIPKNVKYITLNNFEQLFCILV